MEKKTKKKQSNPPASLGRHPDDGGLPPHQTGDEVKHHVLDLPLHFFFAAVDLLLLLYIHIYIVKELIIEMLKSELHVITS